MAAQHDGTRVFLTKEESERIQHTVKDRLKRCSELVGRTREPRDSKDAIRQATGASLMADMGAALGQGQNRDETLPALAVGQPYPPCVISIDELQPMAFTDLQMDTHHRDHRLTVKRVSPVVTLTARSWTMVQDEAGVETERLEISLHTSRHGKDILESASRFIIKEPYFTLTDQGEATLRIDHPSDLIICWDAVKVGGASSADGEKDSMENLATAEKLAIKCKDQGNAALEKRNLALAHARYTQGLSIARRPAVHVAKPNLARDLFRNRAHVNLLLNRLDEAMADAEASLTGEDDQRSKDLDSKAYFRAGSAAYTRGLYAEAKRFFEERLKRTPDDKYATITLRRIDTRLREQGTGKYDLKKIQAGLSRARPRTDVASFISNTKIGDSPGRGRGLFSPRNLAPGAIIMCEKAFCVVWGHESEALTAMTYDVRDGRIRVSPVGLSKSIVQKLAGNPSQIKEVMDLYGDYEGSQDTRMVDNSPVVDTF